MYPLFMGLAMVSFLAMFYSGLGILIPRLPGVRTRLRALGLGAFAFFATGLFAAIAAGNMTPDQKADMSRRDAERSAEREQRDAARRANETAQADARAKDAAASEAARARADAQVWDARTVALPNLLAAYDDNELAADAQFKGKPIQVSGIVDDVKNDILGDAFVILGTGKQFEVPALQCTLTRRAREKAATLHKGDRVTLRGEVRGLMMHVQAGNCEVQ